jgi:hypothetical protein
VIRDVKTLSAIDLNCPKEAALALVWDIKTIEVSELKADKVEVHMETDRKGTYDVWGHFAGVPWQNTFAFELNDRGFHSQEVHPAADGPYISGGFVVQETGPQKCKLLHYEDYKLPWRFVPLKPLIFLYLKWSMGKELRTMREMISKRTATGPANQTR